MKEKNYLSFDFGQSKVKTIIGRFDGEKIRLEDIYRFENNPVYAGGYLQWDILKLYHELQVGIRRSIKETDEIQSIGIVAWGGDFSFIDKNGYLAGNPLHNRDRHSEDSSASLYGIIPKKKLFEITGLQYAYASSSLFRLYFLAVSNPKFLLMIDKYLTVPDIFNYFLTGVIACENTNICISQLMDKETKKISSYLMDNLGIRKNIFPEIVESGTFLGRIQPIVCRMVGCSPTKVILTAEHDTSSALSAVPRNSTYGNWAAISMGTWAILATEVQKPIIAEEAFENGFSNQIGAQGATYFSKDMTGLWIAQECRKKIMSKKQETISWDRITTLVNDAIEFKCFINTDCPLFRNPIDMPKTILGYCEQTRQHIPETEGELFRCIFESLALRFRYNAEVLGKILKKKFDVVY